MDPADYIINAGPGLGGVAKAYDDRQPASANDTTLMKFYQDVANGKMSPTEAAVAFHKANGTPGWADVPAQSAPLPSPGQPGFGAQAPDAGLQTPPEGVFQGTGLAGAGTSLSPEPDRPKFGPIPTAPPQGLLPKTQSPVAQGPALNLDFSNMTKGEAASLMPRLEEMYKGRIAQKPVQDQLELEKLRQQGREKIQTMKGDTAEKVQNIKTDAMKALAVFNSESSRDRLVRTLGERMQEHIQDLQQRDEIAGMHVQVAYDQMAAAMQRAKLAADTATEVAGTKASTDERIAAVQRVTQARADVLHAFSEVAKSPYFMADPNLKQDASLLFGQADSMLNNPNFSPEGPLGQGLQTMTKIAKEPNPVRGGGSATVTKKTDTQSEKQLGSPPQGQWVPVKAKRKSDGAVVTAYKNTVTGEISESPPAAK